MASSARIDELRKKFDENPRRYFAPLANEYRKAGDLSQAIFICQEYLPQQPGHMSGHIVYGQALYEMGRPEEAQVVFETALSLDPENLIALRHLGDIARQANDFTAARSWYQRVLEADPRNEEIAQIMLSLLSAPEPVAQTRPEVSSTAPTPLHTPAVPPTPSFEASQAPAEPAEQDDALFVEKSAEAGFGTPTPKSTTAADSPGDEGAHGGQQHAHADAENPDGPLVAADGNEFLDLDDLTFGGINIGATDSVAAQDAPVEPAHQPAEDNNATVAGFETFEGGSSWTRSPESDTAGAAAPREGGEDLTRQTAEPNDSVVDHSHLFDGPQDTPDAAFEADPFAIAGDASHSLDVSDAHENAEAPQSDSRAAMGIFDEFPQSAADHASSPAAASESHVEPVDLASAIEFLPADQGAPSGASHEALAWNSNDSAPEAQSQPAAGAADTQPGVDTPSSIEASSQENEPHVDAPAFESFAAELAEAQAPEAQPSEALTPEADSSESDPWHLDSFDDLGASAAADLPASDVVHAESEPELSLADSSENAHHAPAGDTPEAGALDSAVVDAEHAPPPSNQSENAEFETASSDTAVRSADETWPSSIEPELSTGFTETAEFAGFGESGPFVDVGAVDPAEADTEEYDTEALASENASNDVPASDEHLASAPAEAFVTETMAEVYLQQGHLESALGIYQRLVEQRPGDAGLEQRMRAVEDRVHGTPAETVAEPASPAVAVYGGPTIRDFLRGLASMRPAERARAADAGEDETIAAQSDGVENSAHANGEAGDDFADAHFSPPTAEAADSTTFETDPASSRFSGETITTSFDELFGGADAEQQEGSESPTDEEVAAEAPASTTEDSPAAEQSTPAAESAQGGEEASPAPLHGLPAHRATSELSLDHVFKRATPARADTDAFSLDRFFSTDATAADAKPQADGRVPPPGTDDIAQFNAWLNGLKKT